MGFLAEAASGADAEEERTPVTEPDISRMPADSEREETPEEKPPEQVAVALPKPLSRRAKAAEDLKAQYEKRAAELEARTARELSETRAAMARMQAELASRPVHQVQVPAQQQAPEPDPDQLFREADQALAKGDLDTYHRKFRESTAAAIRREFAPRFAQVQQAPAQQQMDPQLVAILAQHPDVASHPSGINLAIVEDARLHHMGVAPGPARVRAAFAEVQRQLQAAKGQGGRPAYDAGSAGVLGSAPTSRGAASGGGGTPGEALMMTADEERSLKSIAKKAGIPWDEYIAEYAKSNPQLLRR